MQVEAASLAPVEMPLAAPLLSPAQMPLVHPVWLLAPAGMVMVRQVPLQPDGHTWSAPLSSRSNVSYAKRLGRRLRCLSLCCLSGRYDSTQVGVRARLLGGSCGRSGLQVL